MNPGQSLPYCTGDRSNAKPSGRLDNAETTMAMTKNTSQVQGMKRKADASDAEVREGRGAQNE